MPGKSFPRDGMRVLLVGNRGGTNIGGCLETAAHSLGLEVQLCEAHQAMRAPLWIRRFNWWVRGKRPTWLGSFNRKLLTVSRAWHPTCVLATGIAPVNHGTLQTLAREGIPTVNYLTDDPWSPAHYAGWFLRALPHYSRVFSPRRANLDDLKALGCRQVAYLPFGYAPELHFPAASSGGVGRDRYTADVVFVGGGDQDRVPYITALADAGFCVGLYGSLWERFPGTAPLSHGQAGPDRVREATAGARVALCLVRRANRDGHVMRTFEIAATGTCLLAEGTEEHHAIFGDEGQAVMYFRTTHEMVTKLRWLLAHDDERRRLARAAHHLIVRGRNTYADRLTEMLRGL
jgi:spore maturation protein CgeB